MEKVKALKLSEIAENTSKILEINDKKIAVFNVDGEFYAIDDTCSHAEASLSEGEVFDCIVECPLHGAEFDLTTGEQLPGKYNQFGALPIYDVRVIGSEIWVKNPTT